MTWAEDYLQFALELYRDNSASIGDEARYRICISRAYYAVFNLSKLYFKYTLKITQIKDENEHRSVHMTFEDLEQTTIGIKEKYKRSKMIYGQIAEKISRLRVIRNKADYQEEFQNLKNETRMALRFAEDIYSGINELIELSKSD